MRFDEVERSVVLKVMACGAVNAVPFGCEFVDGDIRCLRAARVRAERNDLALAQALECLVVRDLRVDRTTLQRADDNKPALLRVVRSAIALHDARLRISLRIC